jgi:hypothetical protein
VAEIFMEIEPLAGRRHVAVTAQKTRIDWAGQIREMLEVRYPAAEKMVVVMDNLNTHAIASLYEAFPPAEALRMAQRLEIHYTLKHGSWLNIAEIELSVFKRQCRPERIPNMARMNRKIAAWNQERNTKQMKVNWPFTTETARVKLKRLYSKF